ncbi:uncharacterized protein, partial [Rutidosis leptorrhynchoides]|uniref:uncharacterized protein n=1 Tax=Rutidosis leptorrhynchoides TaxID=125765 RepID=UPI003A9932A2
MPLSISKSTKHRSTVFNLHRFAGTHAITCALFAFLRLGDELLSVVVAPYDTLEEVIGIRDGNGLGSLKDFGIKYREVALADDGGLDWDALDFALKPQTKCALIQRSYGYSWRKSLSVNEIARAIHIIKTQNPNCMVMVDNCYDLIAGSLIKNPGGTISPCGGSVAGKEKWVKAAAARLSAQGLGVDCGSTPGDIMKTFFQGLYLSPQMVGEAIKGGLLIAKVMSTKGYKCSRFHEWYVMTCFNECHVLHLFAEIIRSFNLLKLCYRSMSKECFKRVYVRTKPFIFMIFLQTSYAVNGLVVKSALNKGLNHYTFAVYRNTFAALCFASLAFFFERKVRPKMTISIFIK